MKENYLIEKEIKFSNNIAEIISISLEEKHEFKDNKVEGNFIVSGEYKIHEISLNKEKFSYKIPFSQEIKNDIDPETLELEITNFVYDSDNDNLYVTINYLITGDRKDILLFDDEEDLDEFLKSREVDLVIDDINNDIDNCLEKQEERVVIEGSEKNSEENLEEKREVKEVEPIVEEDKINDRDIDQSKEELLKNVNVDDDNYITYKVHIVKQEDTEEAIMLKYNITMDDLKEYNNYTNLSLGDKLIIPVVNE